MQSIVDQSRVTTVSPTKIQLEPVEEENCVPPESSTDEEKLDSHQYTFTPGAAKVNVPTNRNGKAGDYLQIKP